MGCDIHVIVAYKEEGKPMEIIHDFSNWCGAREDPEPQDWEARWRDTRLTLGRNYERFGKLSGVRGDGPRANGWPEWAHSLPELRDPDLHSHTHYPIRQALQLWLDTAYEDDDNDRVLIAKADPYWFYFKTDPEKWNLDNVWVLISYDN